MYRLNRHCFLSFSVNSVAKCSQILEVTSVTFAFIRGSNPLHVNTVVEISLDWTATRTT